MMTRDQTKQPRSNQEHVLAWKNTQHGSAVLTLKGKRLDIYYCLLKFGTGSFTVDKNFDRRKKPW